VAWKYDTEQPLIGGALATAGGLVFFGEGNGFFKRWTRRPEACCAVPGRSRRQRASGVLHGEGKQYVAVAAGGNTQIDFKRGNSVVVFALP